MNTTQRRIIAVIAVGFLVIAGTGIYLSLIRSQGPPTWDGAEHSLYGLKVYTAVKAGSPDDFITATTSQNLWPFLHSWLLALVFLIAGPTFDAARMVSLMLWVGTGTATVMMARKIVSATYSFPAGSSAETDIGPKLSDKTSLIAGVMALSLFITSPMMMLYAAQPMLEMQGALLTVIALTSSAGLSKKSKLLTGILLLVTLFTKYVYAQFLATALVVNLGIDLMNAFRSAPNKRSVIPESIRNAVLMFGPAAIGGILWFLRPEARAGYMAAVQNPSTTEYSMLSPVNLIIYPVLLLAYYFASPLTAIPAIVCAFRKPFGNRIQRIGIVYILVTILMLTIYWYKLTRAIFSAAPVLYAVAAAGIAAMQADTRLQKRGKIIIVLILFHLPFAFLPGIMLRHHPAMRQEATHMFNFEKPLLPVLESVARAAGEQGPVGIIGDFHIVNPPLIRWVFQRTGKGKSTEAYSLLNWSKPMETIDLVQLMKNASTQIVLIIRVIPGSRFDTDDYRTNYSWMIDNLQIDETRMMKIGESTYDHVLIFELWTQKSSLP